MPLWEAALGGATTTDDPFDNNIAAAATITFDSGVESANSGQISNFAPVRNCGCSARRADA